MADSKTTTYLVILIDTLKKKEALLKKIKSETEQQMQLLDREEFDYEAFDKIIGNKDELLNKLNGLDDGFLELYAKVSDELKNQTEEYAEKIASAQQLVRSVTDLSTEVTALEERNKAKLALVLSGGKQKVKDFKVSSRTAAAYYKSMAGKHQEGDSYFFNRKK